MSILLELFFIFATEIVPISQLNFYIMIYSLTLEISIEEFKVLREAVTSFRSVVWDEDCCDEDVYPGGHPTLRYELVDRLYHKLESFKDRA